MQSMIEVEQVETDDLHPDPANPRHIDQREMDSLTRSIQQIVNTYNSHNLILSRHNVDIFTI